MFRSHRRSSFARMENHLASSAQSHWAFAQYGILSERVAVGEKSRLQSLTRLRVLAPVNAVRSQPPRSANLAYTANRSPNSSATDEAEARTSRAPRRAPCFS